MKKYFLSVFIYAIVSGIIVPAQALAAGSISFVPNSGSFEINSTHSVNIMVDPQNSKIGLVKVEVDYNPLFLKVINFTGASNTMALSQPGYDVIDNINGKLIKTVGFSGGVSTPVSIGTIVFSFVNIGTTTVSVSSTNSTAINSGNVNILNDFGMANYEIVKSSYIAPIKPIVKVEQSTSTDNIVLTAATIAATTSSSSPISNSVSLALIIIVIVLLIGYIFFKRNSVEVN